MGSSLSLDHLVYGVRDLDEAARRLLNEHGLRSVDGGRHPGHGTANRIVPLGAEYIELLAVVDTDEAKGSPLGRSVANVVSSGDRLVGWAVQTHDIEAAAQRLSLPIQLMSRELPAGGELSWKLAGLREALSRPELPFFIQWHQPDLHPGRLEQFTDQAGRIDWVEINADEDEIAAWLGEPSLPVRTTDSGPPIARAGLVVGDRRLVLR